MFIKWPRSGSSHTELVSDKGKDLKLVENELISPLCPVERPALLVLTGELHLALLLQDQGEGILPQVFHFRLNPRPALGAEENGGTRYRFFAFNHSNQPGL